MDVTEIAAAGLASLGIVALVIGIVIAALCLKSLLDGNTPVAVLLGFTLLTLLSPVLSLVLVIVAVIVTAIIGILPLSGYAFGGWLVGLVLMFAVAVCAAAIGAVAA